MKEGRTYRIAIVGTGPAGMYATAHLLDLRDLNVEIDLYERLPTPWGLVRAGVAPDHPEKKLVIDRQFDYVFRHSKVRFIGNVAVGSDIRHVELADWYDAVIYAIGATGDTQMGIPGEELPGCWAAREFVAWYNGHPDFSHLQFDLSHERAVIVGNGNVALDVARILTMPVEELHKTDIADHALAALRTSSVKEVVILGRRGHIQAAFNNPELAELAELSGVDIIVETADLPSDNEVVMDNADWSARCKLNTLRNLAMRTVSNAEKRIVFRFLSSPTELVGSNKVEQVLIVQNRLEHNAQGKLQARATEIESLLDAGLVLRAIGYRGHPFPGLPFDVHRGVIQNRDGRVVDNDDVIPGAYVTGWIKRGPRGVIGTNKKCSRDTVRALLEDIDSNQLLPATLDADAVMAIVEQRQPDLVLRSDWLQIDHQEREAGRKQQRPRVKFTQVDAMLACLNKA